MIMAALTFISGSFLSRAVQLISNNLRHANAVYYSGLTSNVETIPEENPHFEIVRIDNPQKVIRGGSFELIVYVRSEKRVYGNYSLVVNLFNLDSRTRIRSGKYQIVGLKDWPKETTLKIGPFKVLAPPEISLGKSIIEVKMVSDSGSEVAVPYAKSTIEVISHHQS